MTNIVIPLAGNLFFDSTEYYYPKPLIEIRGTPIIQLVIDCLNTIDNPKRFIFVLNRKDDAKFHLRDTLRLVTNGQCEFVTVEGPTKGAACSVLMAISYLQGSNPVIVANGDQLVNMQLATVITDFTKRKLEAGVICFDSVHPRWSYVRLNDDGYVVEAAEKRPLTRNAVAGFYYFAKGDDFLRLAMKSIEKGSDVNGQFYVAPVLNEYV
ncbi:MAG: glycosyltransferase family 2 protein, partial [Bdellovibrionales bacterium]